MDESQCSMEVPVHVDEQEAWVNSISLEMSGQTHATELPGRFFKVPAPQREANAGAYDPYVFSFGPHHAKFDSRPSVPANTSIKLQAAKAMIEKAQFDALVTKIQEWDTQLRSLYGGEHDRHIGQIRAPTLAHLLALDAVTIVAATFEPQVFEATAVATVLWKDVILLENQVPLIVLWEAMEWIRTRRSMQEFIRWHLHAASPFSNASTLAAEQYIWESEMNQSSLLACIYDGLTGRTNSPPCGNTSMISTASHLRRCGIRFRGRDGLFTSIDFKDKTLRLPRILVAHDTQRLLLNLLAYEATSRFPQCCAVTSYVTLMDCLINGEGDVAVLVECGIIENHMGSHAELASMWNKLRVGVPTLFTLSDASVITRVNRASKFKWRKWMVAFGETFWERKPWLLISIVAATALLLLSFLQTFYTIRQSY